MMTYQEYRSMPWQDRQDLRIKIQDSYDPKRSDSSIAELKAAYGSELIERLICEQLCVHCDGLSTGIDVFDEQACDKCISDSKADSDPVEVPDWNSDSDSIRRFGERLAALDDSEAAIYEERFLSQRDD